MSYTVCMCTYVSGRVRDDVQNKDRGAELVAPQEGLNEARGVDGVSAVRSQDAATVRCARQWHRHTAEKG